MGKIINQFSSILIIVFILIAGCNKESYIETVGKVMLEEGDDTSIGTYIFTSGSAVTICGQVSIYIDDAYAGELTQTFTGSATCSTLPVDGKVMKVVVASGSHKITVKYKDKCKPDISVNHSLNQGYCMWYTIN